MEAQPAAFVGSAPACHAALRPSLVHGWRPVLDVAFETDDSSGVPVLISQGFPGPAHEGVAAPSAHLSPRPPDRLLHQRARRSSFSPTMGGRRDPITQPARTRASFPQPGCAATVTTRTVTGVPSLLLNVATRGANGCSVGLLITTSTSTQSSPRKDTPPSDTRPPAMSAYL